MATPKLQPLTKKNFWFKRRNIQGQPFGEPMDVDERTAWNYLKIPRNFEYLGYSTGKHIVDAYKVIRERGDGKTVTDEDKELINDAIAKELADAEQNKVRPFDYSKQSLGGGPMDPRIRL